MTTDIRPDAKAGTFRLPILFSDDRRYGTLRLLTEEDFNVAHGQLHRLVADAFIRHRSCPSRLYLLQVTDTERPKIGYAYPLHVNQIFESHGYRALQLVVEIQQQAVQHENVDFAVLVAQATLTSRTSDGNPEGLAKDVMVISMMSADCMAVSNTYFTVARDGSIQLGESGQLEFFGPSTPPASVFVRFSPMKS